MNWRDPKTDLVHVLNYREHESPWLTSRTGPMGDRAMRCGLLVKVDSDGTFSLGVLRAQFSHTRDAPSCLRCLVAADPLDHDGDS